MANGKKRGRYAVFITLVMIAIVGILVSIFIQPLGLTLEPYVPKNEKVMLDNKNSPNVAVVYEDNMLIPLKNYVVEKRSPITVEILNSSWNVEKVKLSANSTSFLTYTSEILPKNKTQNPNVYNTSATVRHPLLVQNSSEPFNLMVFYTEGNNGTKKYSSFPFVWNIKTLDFDNVSYFFIIFLGVTLSRVFTVRPKGSTGPGDVKGKAAKLSFRISNAAFVWVPFSAIITLLIFSGFKDKVTLTTDLIINFALAFGFGFGFDKVFETWQKSVEPDSATETTEELTEEEKAENKELRRDAMGNKK
jgi:hypothetical protein